MIDIDDFMNLFCRAGADAIFRYVEVSGEGPADMPEYFLPAMILQQLGSTISMTLETRFSKLSEWNNNARVRHCLSRLPNEEQDLLHLAEEVGSPRVDMVVYDRPDLPKNEQGFLALVEFKKGWIAPDDRLKLFGIFPHADTCPYGITCGSMTNRQLQYEKEQVRGTGDLWYECPVPDFQDKGIEPYWFGARLITNPNFIRPLV